MRYQTIGKLVVSSLFLSNIMVVASAEAAIIGIDNTHGFNANNFLGSGSDFNTFRSTITDLGHTIVPLTSYNSASLAGLDAAIFSIPFSQNSDNYTASEINDINSFANQRAVFISDTSLFKDENQGSDRPITFGDNLTLLQNVISFIASGNGALFLGDNGIGFQVNNLNQLVANYGISYATQPTDIGGRTVSSFVPSVLTAGLNEVAVDFQLPLTINSPSIDLTVPGGQDNILASFTVVPDTVVPEPTSTLSFLALGTLGTASILKRKLNSSTEEKGEK